MIYLFPCEVDERSNEIEELLDGLALDILHDLIEALADRDDLHVALEDHMKGKELEEDLALDVQVVAERLQVSMRRVAHIHRGHHIVLFVLEVQLEYDVREVVLHGVREHVDVHVQAVEDLAHLLDLALDIVDEALPLAPVVQYEAGGALVLDEKARRLELVIAEAHVLVQVVQAVEEVAHVTAEHAQNLVIAVSANEVDKVDAQLFHQFVLLCVCIFCILIKVTS